jgi:hypothetical protein
MVLRWTVSYFTEVKVFQSLEGGKTKNIKIKIKRTIKVMMIKASTQNTVNIPNTASIPVKVSTLVIASILPVSSGTKLAITINTKREGIIRIGNHPTLDLKPR